MTDCLFLSPNSGPELEDDTQVDWLQADGECARLGLAEAAEQLAGKSLALVMPVEVVSSFLLELPNVKDRLLRKALPFVVEELLAEDVELFHLALGEQHDDGRHRVLAVRRDMLAHWLAQLRERGLLVEAIYVDADLLPRDGVQALLMPERGLIGGVGELRMAFAPEYWPQLHEQLPTAQVHEHEEQPYAWLAAGRVAAVNLAQGEFEQREAHPLWSLGRFVAVWFGIWLVLQLGFNTFQGLYYAHQADELEQASVALYKELFPSDKRIINIRAQLAEHLRAGTQSSQAFLALIDGAASALAVKEAQLTVTQADYSETRGDLALQVRANDFAEVEQLRQRLSEAGLAVQMGSANREDDGVSARVILGGGQ